MAKEGCPVLYLITVGGPGSVWEASAGGYACARYLTELTHRHYKELRDSRIQNTIHNRADAVAKPRAGFFRRLGAECIGSVVLLNKLEVPKLKTAMVETEPAATEMDR